MDRTSFLRFLALNAIVLMGSNLKITTPTVMSKVNMN